MTIMISQNKCLLPGRCQSHR